MQDPIYRSDPYCRTIEAVILAHTPEGGLVAQPELFYPTGGGQPGDSGWVDWEGGRLAIATTLRGNDGRPVLLPEGPAPLPPVGGRVVLHLDWERRYSHMRVHTALHLLSVVIPLPVTGGQISAGKGRLDFDMPTPPEDIEALEVALNRLVDCDLKVGEDWITDEELDANPGLVKTMAVQPPRGQGRVRLVRIGEGAGQVDLQPCGGTHVARTAEIGHVRLGKIEKKGRVNRRVTIFLDGAE
jgi:misacylated tRNA(Ala) deacylase